MRLGSIAYRALKDGRELVVYPLLFGRARLGIGKQGVGMLDDQW